jgi:hypothetical protein
MFPAGKLAIFAPQKIRLGTSPSFPRAYGKSKRFGNPGYFARVINDN